MALIKFRRGTRAEIDAAATAGELNLGEPYFITDDEVQAVGTGASSYVEFPTLTDLSGYTQAAVNETISGNWTFNDVIELGLSSGINFAGQGDITESSNTHFIRCSGISVGLFDVAGSSGIRVIENYAEMYSDDLYVGATNTVTAEGVWTFDNADGTGIKLAKRTDISAVRDSNGAVGRIIDPDVSGIDILSFGDLDNIFGTVTFGIAASDILITTGAGFYLNGAKGGGRGVNTLNAKNLLVDGHQVHHDGHNTFAQYTSTDTTTDINTASWVAIPFNSTIDEEAGYSLNGTTHEVTLAEAGTYRVYAQVAYSTASIRTNPGLAINVNGTRTGRRGLMGYVRALNDHDEGSLTIEEWITTTTANETVSIEALQYAAAGTCNLISNASILIIERKR